MAKKQTKTVSMWISFFFGITFAYFVWLSWDKLTEFIGNSTLVWGITGGIVLIGLLLGKFTFKRIMEAFA